MRRRTVTDAEAPFKGTHSELKRNQNRRTKGGQLLQLIKKPSLAFSPTINQKFIQFNIFFRACPTITFMGLITWLEVVKWKMMKLIMTFLVELVDVWMLMNTKCLLR